MDDTQKKLIMVCVISFVVFLITGYDALSSGNEESTIFTKVTGYTTYKYRTNWLGIIGLASTIGCAVGFFLFKDKK